MLRSGQYDKIGAHFLIRGSPLIVCIQLLYNKSCSVCSMPGMIGFAITRNNLFQIYLFGMKKQGEVRKYQKRTINSNTTLSCSDSFAMLFLA